MPAPKKAAAPSKKLAPEKKTPKPRGHGTPKRRNNNAVLAIPHRTADLLENPESIKEWDDEELERGYRRARNGKFVGGPPLVVPRIVHQEIVRRKMLKAQDLLRGGLVDAINTLTWVMHNSEDDKAKVAAAKIVLDRNLGNMPIPVEIETPKWAQALSGGIVAVTKGDEDDDIVDAEIVPESKAS